MVTPPNRSLRRLKLEELLSKIEQIEEQVSMTLQEYPHGHTIERQRLVLAIARQIGSHLKDQLRDGTRVAVLGEESEHPHLRVVDGQRSSAADG
jgi:23S rRNA G2445 N2-methylase RlmL